MKAHTAAQAEDCWLWEVTVPDGVSMALRRCSANICHIQFILLKGQLAGSCISSAVK
jgi:hypothetical protein